MRLVSVEASPLVQIAEEQAVAPVAVWWACKAAGIPMVRVGGCLLIERMHVPAIVTHLVARRTEKAAAKAAR